MSAIMDVDGSSTRGRWWDIERLLLKGGPLAPSEFEPSREVRVSRQLPSPGEDVQACVYC